MEAASESSPNQGKNLNPIEQLSKEDLISKYKGLLSIAKKAKQAKDELAEENRKLKDALSRSETQKEADKKALMTMKEMLEEFTENKLRLTSELSELQRKVKEDEETLNNFRIENESLKRQLSRLTDDNESLLHDIDSMENQLKQVNILGLEQKKHLELLETEVNKLKETESLNASLQNQLTVNAAENKALKEQANEARQELDSLSEKYQNLKGINSEQRKKFNSLKDRFIDIHRQVKKLKECKRVLLETQHEYGDAVTKWQREIIEASQVLCAEMNALKLENEKLRKHKNSESNDMNAPMNVEKIAGLAEELENLGKIVAEEIRERSLHEQTLLQEHEELKRKMGQEKELDNAEREHGKIGLENKSLNQELQDLRVSMLASEETVKLLQTEKETLQQQLQERRAIEEDYERLKKVVEQYEENQHLANGKLKELQAERDSLRQQKLHRPNDVANSEIDNSDILNRLALLEESQVEKEKLEAKVLELSGQLQQTFEHARGDEQRKAIGEISNPQQAIHALENEVSQCCQSYNELLHGFQQKEREHTDLLAEMRELNEALKARGDVISRQQEKQQELGAELKKTTAQLKQIEESLNEKEDSISRKDMQVRDISREVEEAYGKVRQLQELCRRSEVQMQTLTEELHTLRNADAPIDTQSDAQSTSTLSRADEINRMREVEDSYEEKYNKLRGMTVKLKKKLQDQTAYVAEMEKQIQSGSSVTVKKELDEALKRVNELQAENQKLKSSRKQANVLNLEIEAAEKSLQEATAKLAAKSSDLEMLRESLTSKENTISQLRKEIAILEQAKESELFHSKELKEQIDRLQSQIKDAVHSKQNVLIASKELEQAHETLKMELKEARLQLSNSTSVHETAMSALNAENEQLKRSLIHLQEKLQASENKFETAERSLEELRVQYADYKVKAQTVLRKNQGKDASKENELQEELQALRSEAMELQSKESMYIEKIEKSEREIDLLKDANEGLTRRCNELVTVVEDLQRRNESLAGENRDQMHQHQQSLRIQLENLDICHKKQLQEMEINYERQMEQLRSELTKVRRQPPVIGAPIFTKSAHLPTSPMCDMHLMEREDAEGSEEAEAALASIAANRKISNASYRSNHDFMPLDELLNVPMNAISDTVTTMPVASLGRSSAVDPDVDDFNGNSSGSLETAYVELQATKERLQIQESRVRHLTALLAENEQDLAKLTQMNDMLKEELRRQERGVEREKHMHNSEYLKNVIVKFLTLNNADERSRLVPVLNTILKLSRSETEMLNCVAKGQKVSSDPNARGWTTFLPSWGGGGGNN